MAISTDAAIDFFNADTTALEESGGSASVSDGAFSLFDGTDIDNWTNADDASKATIWLQMDSAGTPAVNSGCVLVARGMNFTDIPGTTDTNDGDIPTAIFVHIPIGFFPVKNVTGEQFIPIEVFLPNWETQSIYQFGIWNQTGASIGAGWGFHIRAKATGPHA